jgi:hypothetical protein
MRTTRRGTAFALDEALTLFPLDKLQIGQRTSCVALRLAPLLEDLKQAPTSLALHRRELGRAAVGTITNFGELYAHYCAITPYTEVRYCWHRRWQEHGFAILRGDRLAAVLSAGDAPVWRQAPRYHYDAHVGPHGEVHFRVAIGEGDLWSVDASRYYSVDYFRRIAYQFLEESLDEEQPRPA